MVDVEANTISYSAALSGVATRRYGAELFARPDEAEPLKRSKQVVSHPTSPTPLARGLVAVQLPRRLSFSLRILTLVLRWSQGGDGPTRVGPVCAGAVAFTIQFVSAYVPPNRVRRSQSLLALIVSVARLGFASRLLAWSQRLPHLRFSACLGPGAPWSADPPEVANGPFGHCVC